jgi:hypothetical protein
MTFLLVSFLTVLSGYAALSLRRLWSELPDRNLDFALTPEDLELEPRS